jgi:(2Fe-2S) ferredoxin
LVGFFLFLGAPVLVHRVQGLAAIVVDAIQHALLLLLGGRHSRHEGAEEEWESGLHERTLSRDSSAAQVIARRLAGFVPADDDGAVPESLPPRSKISGSEIAAARKHLFLCIGPDCCGEAEGRALWDRLKIATRSLEVTVLRTKAACLRVCAGGPWLVVYPEGTWYGAMTADRLDRVLREHVMGGTPVAEWVVARTGCGD